MKFKSTGFLLLIFAGLLAYVYFVEIRGKEKTEKAKELASKLLTFKKDSLSTIYLKASGIQFQKENNKWVIVQPIRAQAENWVVNGLINSLESAKKDRIISSSRSSFSEYGLAPPKNQIIIGHEGKQDTLYLGDKTPTGSFAFASVNSDSHVYATGTLLFTNADKKLFDFRDKSVLSFENNNVDKIKIQSPVATIEARKEDGKWYLLKAGEKIRADESKISQIMSQIKNAKAKKFVQERPEKLARYGLIKPQYLIELNSSDNSGSHTLQIGRMNRDVYYARDLSRDPIFTVDSSLVHKLKVQFWDLREKKLADFLSYQVDYFELREGDTTLVCEKDTSDTWQVLQPQKGKAKSWKVSSITSAASSLRAVKIVEEHPKSLKRYGLDRPKLQIICKKKGQEIANIKIGNKVGDHYYAIGDISTAVVQVKKEDVEKLKITLQDILEKKSEQE